MIEKAIYEILADTNNAAVTALLALLPISKITTGTAHDQALPYASLSIESDTANYRSNMGSQRDPLVRWQLWHEDHAAGVAIREAIADVFDNQTFTTSETTITCSRLDNKFALQEEDGVWQFTLDFTLTYRSR